MSEAEKLLRAISKAADDQVRSYWYQSGYDAEQAALNMIQVVIEDVLRNLAEEK